MRTLVRIVLLSLFVFGVTQAEEDGKVAEEEGSGSVGGVTNEETDGKTTDGVEAEDSDEDLSDKSDREGETESEEENEEGESAYKEFVCNLQYKRIGCYASTDEGEVDKPVRRSTVDLKETLPDKEKFNEQLPKVACMCANEALTSGNAIFGLMNYSECWSGPDDSKYDRQGPSNECVTFDFAPCEPPNEICAGKELANFMYYIDTPDHNKTPDEVSKELEEEKGKLEATDNDKKKKKGRNGRKKGDKKKGNKTN